MKQRTYREEQNNATPEETYRALERTLRRIQGFGLVFIQCSPAEGERVIEYVRQKISSKQVEVLRLENKISYLYDEIETFQKEKPSDILFITGIEKSLVDYIKLGIGGQGDYYKEDTVPRILGHVNLQRERFRDNFDICFVFLVRKFAYKYFIRRAPDFFDWHSGMFEIPTELEILEQESSRLILEGDYENYLLLSDEERKAKLVEFKECLEDERLSQKKKVYLWFELGNLYASNKEYRSALSLFEKVLQLNPNDDLAWYNRGNALSQLGQNEEALSSFEQVLQFNPNDDLAWYNRAKALFYLEQYEEAIVSFEKVLQINPNDYLTWNNRGVALGLLGKYEEALSSFEQTLQLNPDQEIAWNNQGVALSDMGKYKEAIASFEKVLQLNPNNDLAWYNKACCYALQDEIELAVESLQHAITLNPEDNRERARTDSNFDCLCDNSQFKILITDSVALNSKYNN